MRLISALTAVLLGLSVTLSGAGAARAAAGYPTRDAGYHSYPEMVRHIQAVAAAYPHIVRVFSIGRSHEGRELWAAEVSDRPGEDEGEPEILFDGLHHAREHLSAEMPLYILDLLTSRYGQPTRLGRRVTRLVDQRRTWIVFMVNPDGLQHDLGGTPYRAWRRNRQPVSGRGRVGIDLNRNYGYRFGCCGGSSGRPGAWDYRGTRPWSAPETRAMRDFVRSRMVGGSQRIRTHITFHTAGEMVLWPYGHTREALPPDMTRLDQRAFRAMGQAMADRNGYRAARSSALYPTDGDMIDWTYARHRVFSFTFELYPRGGGERSRYYPPDEVIGRETRRNREAVLYLMGRAICPYGALGRQAARDYCGPFFDDMEIDRGWRVDPEGTDSATDGAWQRGDPQRSDLQLGSAASGQAVLVTGRRPGHDVDGGRTTVRSPLIGLPARRAATLHLRTWVGMTAGATAEDGLRIHLVDHTGARLATVFEVRGSGARQRPRWRSLALPLPGDMGGQLVALELEAVDAGAGAVVEAAVDDVRITTGG